LIASIIIAIALARTIGSQGLADRLEVIAGIEAFRDFADVLAKGLAIAQERRACEHVDLGTGIVDVIFARDVEARKLQQARQRIAKHGAAAMADMHRPGRIGRDVFDIDLLRRADRALAVA
jgi:hypothetical protein